MREYDNETLTRVQKAELGILRDFVDFDCSCFRIVNRVVKEEK